MAKTMARVEGGVTVNLEWRADDTPQTDTLIDLLSRPVALGDTYSGGKFYRDGQEVLSALAENGALRQQLADMQEALEIMGVRVDG